MSIILHAPNKFPLVPLGIFTKVFLAGSIEMGNAEDWQSRIASDFSDENVIFLNPRRPDWDSSWDMNPTPGSKFHEQVTWEQDHIDSADIVVFYFDPKTQSPITLLELGSCLDRKDCLVCCSPDYFRYGNVKITCDRHGVDVVHTYEEFTKKLKEMLD